MTAVPAFYRIDASSVFPIAMKQLALLIVALILGLSQASVFAFDTRLEQIENIGKVLLDREDQVNAFPVPLVDSVPVEGYSMEQDFYRQQLSVLHKARLKKSTKLRRILHLLGANQKQTLRVVTRCPCGHGGYIVGDVLGEKRLNRKLSMTEQLKLYGEAPGELDCVDKHFQPYFEATMKSRNARVPSQAFDRHMLVSLCGREAVKEIDLGFAKYVTAKAEGRKGL